MTLGSTALQQRMFELEQVVWQLLSCVVPYGQAISPGKIEQPAGSSNGEGVGVGVGSGVGVEVGMIIVPSHTPKVLGVPVQLPESCTPLPWQERPDT